MSTPVEQTLSGAAVATTGAWLLGFLQGNMGWIASAFSAVWLALQIIISIQNQIDRRRLLRLQAVQDIHTMRREDAVSAAIETKPIVPVVVLPATTVTTEKK